MSMFRSYLRTSLLCAATVVSSLAFAAEDKALDNELADIAHQVKVMDEQYPAKGITTAEAADAAIGQSLQLQNRLELWANGAERHCYQTFFVNDCVKNVKVERRAYLPVLQRISIEAKALQRQLKVMERDKELAQKQAQ